MPSIVWYDTVTSAALATLSRTVNSADSPSLTAAELSIDSSGAASSSVIVPTPVPSATVAPDAELSSTVNVSVSSAVLSSMVGTAIVCLVSLASKRSVPEADV